MSIIQKAIIELDGEWPSQSLKCIYMEHYKSKNNWAVSSSKLNALFSKEQFEAEAYRMRGKPDWKDAPDGYQWLAQNNLGVWWWYPAGKSPELSAGCFGLNSDEYPAIRAIEGAVIGDWRNTLEKRPEQKAETNESGYINGYKFMKEYTEKGKPNLPDDVLVSVMTNGRGRSPAEHVGSLNWASPEIKSFRITDQRYKPAEPEPAQPAPAKPWFDAGELPKAGTKCLCYFDDGRECWHECVVIGSVESEVENGYLAVSLIGKHERKLIWANDFKPIRTDKEKAIEAAIKVCTGVNIATTTDGLTMKTLNKLYDAGLLRLPEAK